MARVLVREVRMVVASHIRETDLSGVIVPIGSDGLVGVIEEGTTAETLAPPLGRAGGGRPKWALLGGVGAM
ncbi:hypothetical protein WDU99_14095 [Microbacterium sp. Mu-80]|uniref:CBS domain-containing protein n=1 Tax=Microbacterium bandirmense TaxID=3122050 RepID=A0ABU8LDN4_9MICO